MCLQVTIFKQSLHKFSTTLQQFIVHVKWLLICAPVHRTLR